MNFLSICCAVHFSVISVSLYVLIFWSRKGNKLRFLLDIIAVKMGKYVRKGWRYGRNVLRYEYYNNTLYVHAFLCTHYIFKAQQFQEVMDSCYVWQETSTVDSLSKPQWTTQFFCNLTSRYLKATESENFDANDFIGRRKVERKYFLFQILYLFIKLQHCTPC